MVIPTMVRHHLISILLLSLLTACSPNSATSTPEFLTLQFTAAAQPWLLDINDCSGSTVINAQLRAVDYIDLEISEMAIRIGDSQLDSPAYQIGTEDILIITNPQNPIPALTAAEVFNLFTGQVSNWQDLTGLDAPVQVWVFSSGEDIQQIFERTALAGSPVTSRARLATSPQDMAQNIADDKNAIGILTRRWTAANVSAVRTVTTVPVLALTASEPPAEIQDLLTCLQK